MMRTYQEPLFDKTIWNMDTWFLILIISFIILVILLILFFKHKREYKRLDEEKIENEANYSPAYYRKGPKVNQGKLE